MLKKNYLIKLIINYFFLNNYNFLWKIRWFVLRLIFFNNDLNKKYLAYTLSRKKIRSDLKKYIKILPKYLSKNNLEIGCNFGHTLTSLAKNIPKNFFMVMIFLMNI